MTPSPLPPEILAWEAAGEYLRVGVASHRLFVRSIGRRDAAPASTLLLVHGFPESSLSFRHNVEALSRRFDRVVLLDLLGFGLSDKPSCASYSLFEQADLVLEAWHELGVSGGHLLGHDMGDSVVTELVARLGRGLLPGWLAHGFPSLTFTDGNMVMELARLRLSQSLLRTRLGPWLGRIGRYGVFAQQVRSASGGALPEREIALMWAAMQHNEGARVQARIRCGTSTSGSASRTPAGCRRSPRPPSPSTCAGGRPTAWRRRRWPGTSRSACVGTPASRSCPASATSASKRIRRRGIAP